MAKKPKADKPANGAGQPKRGRGRPKKAVPTNVNPEAMAACYSEYSGFMGDIARLGQRIAAMFGRYEKSDGVDSKSIKYAYTMAQKDPEIAAAQAKRNQEYLRILGIVEFDEAGQGDFSAGLDTEVPKPILSRDAKAKVEVARAHADGYNSGKAGGNPENNPHKPGEETHVKWLEGFHDGHADRLLKNPDADKVKEASTRRTRREPTAAPDPEKVQELAGEITRELAETEPAGAVH